MKQASLHIGKKTFFNPETKQMEEKMLVIIDDANPDDFVNEYLYYLLQAHNVPEDAIVVFWQN